MSTSNTQDGQLPTSDWCERKTKPGNRADSPVHLTRNGHLKVDAIHEYLRELWNEGETSDLPLVNMMGGPPKCGVLEWGLDLALAKLGVRPIEIIRAANAGKPTIDIFRQQNRQLADNGNRQQQPTAAVPVIPAPTASKRSKR